MSSHNQRVQWPQQPFGQNLPANFGSEGWMTNPFGLTPSVSGTPYINDVGNGQQSSYKEQTYTLPGSMSYHEWSG